MKRKKKRDSKFWETYGPRFEETDRKLLARIAELEKQMAEENTARDKADAA